MHWPDNPFWDYALELYRRPGVEEACLELQRRHGLDVNLVLLCCWLARRGIAAKREWLAQATEALASWRDEVICPLRTVRGRLKADLAHPLPGSIAARWPELTAALRARVLSLEIDSERLEQLLLAAFAGNLATTGPAGIALASANLRRYRRFARPDRKSLATLLQAAFPEVAAGEVAAALDGLEP